MLALDMPYQRNVANRLIPFKSNWENKAFGGSIPNVIPDSTEFVPGSRFTHQQYVSPGSTPNYPQFNFTDLRRINKEGFGKEDIKKTGGKKCTCKKKGGSVDPDVVKKIASAIEGSIDLTQLSGNGKYGGKIDTNKIKNAVASVAKVAGPVILDFGIPAITTAVATHLGVPVAGPVVGKIIRGAVKHLTGYGRKQPVKPMKRPAPMKKPMKRPAPAVLPDDGVAEYMGGKRKAPVKRKVGDKMAKRNALIRKLMSEKNLTLPMASKYIKEHNLL